MPRKLLIATSIALSAAAFTLNAATDTTNTSLSEMPKDAWLGAMTPMLPDLICKGFAQDAELKKRFDELKMTVEQCVSLIPESTSKCQKEIYDKIPAMVNKETASTWGRALGECIGRDFAEKHLVPKS